MTVYKCPRCGKGLVTEDPEPPGIIHKCDDCVERMVQADDGQSGGESGAE